jgi:hypothetical protein
MPKVIQTYAIFNTQPTNLPSYAHEEDNIYKPRTPSPSPHPPPPSHLSRALRVIVTSLLARRPRSTASAAAVPDAAALAPLSDRASVGCGRSRRLGGSRGSQRRRRLGRGGRGASAGRGAVAGE